MPDDHPAAPMPQFEPLRRASRARLVAAMVLGPASLAWGIAISVVATVQLGIALAIRHSYDRLDFRPFLLGPLYPLAYWAISASAALRCQALALATGPGDRRVVWDLEREALPPDAAASPPGR